MKVHSRTSGVLERASEGIGSVLSCALKVAGGSRAVAFRALLCNATLSGGAALLEPTLPGKGEEGLWSVIIPTYNRLPILRKCLEALEEQEGYERCGIKEYEVVVVDDGSTDGTLEYLATQSHGGVLTTENLLTPVCTLLESSRVFPHVKVIRQQHGGRISMCPRVLLLRWKELLDEIFLFFCFSLYHHISSE
jgi:hypothetical protein